MQLLEMLRIIWINILENRFKVILSSLGIIVGATTIVLVIAIGKGGEAEITKQFGNLSAATIYINPDESKIRGANIDIRQQIEQLNYGLMKEIKKENPFLEDMMIMNSGLGNVNINGESYLRNITGVTAEYENIFNLSTIYGENITENDVEDKAMVAVIGFSVATNNFARAEHAVGEYLSINNRLLKIIGVIGRTGENVGIILPDSSVFIPYSVGEEYVFNNYSIPRAVALANDVSNVNKAMKWLRSSLTYFLENGDAYIIEDVGSRMEVALQSAKIMSMVLVAVAVIVFIVSGIGIMNVLFVSVKERTREIGILKALGYSEGNILLQFLLESIAISVFGSIVGMFLSRSILPFMEHSEIPILPSLEGHLTALFFSLLTGIIFGFYPAYRAAKEKPIDALNYE